MNYNLYLINLQINKILCNVLIVKSNINKEKDLIIIFKHVQVNQNELIIFFHKEILNLLYIYYNYGSKT